MPTPRSAELDAVVLPRDLPDAGLEADDLGAVVQVYGANAVEVLPDVVRAGYP